MNHLIKKLTGDTARLVIAMPPPASTLCQPSIIRHRLDQRGIPAKSPGTVVGLEKGQSYALVLNVKIGDLISLGEPTTRGFTSSWRHFRMGTEFELILLDIHRNELSCRECCALVSAYDSLKQPNSGVVELRAVFQSTDYPGFLAEIFDRHLRNLREQEPAQYFQLVPWRITDEDLPDLVRTVPFVALEFHKSKLDAEQLARCIRCSLAGGVLFAFDEMSPTQVDLATEECPGVLLTHRPEKLTDDQIERCVRNDPATAFQLREEFTPGRHAIVLANSYMEGFPSMFCGLLPEFQIEIETSITCFPEPWLRTHNQDFGQIFTMLDGFAQMGVDSALLSRLLQRMPPDYSEALSRHLAKKI